jgi:hypothetical protein
MFTVALVVMVIAVIARLVAVVRDDRPLTTPRSHTHELDRHSAGTLRVR